MQRNLAWNDCSQKQKQNYGRHPIIGTFFEFWFGDLKKCPSSHVVSHCATSVSALASLVQLLRREGGGGGVSRRCQGAFGLAAAGRKGGCGRALAFWGSSVATPSATGREGGGGGGHATAFWGARRSRDSRVGEWQWACCGIVRMAFFEVALAGRRRRGREGRGGTTHFAR